MIILINALSTKRHAGGAYQIAYNFILETVAHPEFDWYYVVSADLDEALPDRIKIDSHYYSFPTQPDFLHSYFRVKKELQILECRIKPNVVYSITAPSYFSFNSLEVMRFTMPWVTHPNKYSWSVLTVKEKFKMSLYCWNQRRMIRKSVYFITQSETTRQGIIRITGTNPENVKVVPNVLPSVYLKVDDTPIPSDGEWINIACVGNATAHKNFEIIPDVLAGMRDRGISNVRFHVTLPENTAVWRRIQALMKSRCIEDGIVNHGRISQIELAEMYRKCQLCFLPTLLEVFSASTVEAMYFHLPTVATDFDFNHEVMDDSCLYYSPKNAEQAVNCITRLINDEQLRNDLIKKMEQRLKLFGDYEKHFIAIMDFLMSVGSR